MIHISHPTGCYDIVFCINIDKDPPETHRPAPEQCANLWEGGETLLLFEDRWGHLNARKTTVHFKRVLIYLCNVFQFCLLKQSRLKNLLQPESISFPNPALLFFFCVLVIYSSIANYPKILWLKTTHLWSCSVCELGVEGWCSLVSLAQRFSGGCSQAVRQSWGHIWKLHLGALAVDQLLEFTCVVVGKALSPAPWISPQGGLTIAAGEQTVDWKKVRQYPTEVSGFLRPNRRSDIRHCCHILSIRTQSLDPAHTREGGVLQEGMKRRKGFEGFSARLPTAFWIKVSIGTSRPRTFSRKLFFTAPVTDRKDGTVQGSNYIMFACT